MLLRRLHRRRLLQLQDRGDNYGTWCWWGDNQGTRLHRRRLLELELLREGRLLGVRVGLGLGIRARARARVCIYLARVCIYLYLYTYTCRCSSACSTCSFARSPTHAGTWVEGWGWG